MIDHVFSECGIMVEDFPGPDGVPQARFLVILDPASGQRFRYGMDVEQAKALGAKLMGIGKLQVVNGTLPLDANRNGHAS